MAEKKYVFSAYLILQIIVAGPSDLFSFLCFSPIALVTSKRSEER